MVCGFCVARRRREVIIELLYGALEKHLAGQRKARFSRALDSPSAKARYLAFCNEFQAHRSELTADLRERYDSLLDAFVKSLKVNRDDVAHQRTTRIDPDTALMGIHSMLALAALIYEISEALRAPCKTTKKI